MALSKDSYKGTRDFYPEDKRILNYIFSTWRSVVESFGYEEYDAPLIEMTDLYRAKTGEEIVDNQLYSFKDRGDRDVAIRPEMTPSLARMVANRRQELPYPARWYSIPNLWRYERPQRGRLREHWQLNVDIIGVERLDAELELILIAAQIMEKFGATPEMYTIKINSRKVSALLMAQYLELSSSQAQAMAKVLDKKDKMEEASFIKEAEQVFPEDKRKEGITKLKTIVAAKTMADLPEAIRESDAIRQVQILFTLLKDNGIKNATFDISLMRGLDYYTDIVFEVFDTNKENPRSLFGGGRYDGLVGIFDVEDIPAAGFGMGDVTIADFLNTHSLLPDLNSKTDIYLAVVGDVGRQAQGIANILRNQGLSVEVDISGNKVEKQIKSADKKQIKYIMFVGEEELNTEKFPVKNLDSGKEDKYPLGDIPKLVSQD